MIDDRTKELGTRKISQLLLIYAVPAVISQVISSIYNIVDRIFIGNGVGALAIAGLAITMPIMNIIHAFGSLVGAGAGARMSIVLGKKDIPWAERILFNSLHLTFFFGALFLTFGYVFLDEILALFGATELTIQYASEYMRIVLPGMFMTTLTYNLVGEMRSSGYPIKATIILASGAVLNTILDPIFIFVFDLGIKGAAMATTISMCLTGIVSFAHFCSRKSFIRIRRHAWKPKLFIIKNILLIGMSPFFLNLAASAVVALVNTQLLRYGGDYAVGALGVVNSYASFIIMFMVGICQGMQPIAGYNYGAGLPQRLKAVYMLTARINVGIGFVGTILCLTIPQLLIRVFTDDANIMEIGVVASKYIMILFPFVGFQITNSNFFQSIDKPWISIVTSLSRQLIFMAPMLYIFPPIWESFGADPLSAIWASFTASDFCGFALATVLLLTQRKVFREKQYVN